MALRQKKKALVRGRILQECEHLFRTKGFDATTINDITATCGISRQTFFNYFAGKDSVLTELGISWLRQQSEVPRLGPHSVRDKVVLEGTRNAIRSQIRAIKSDAEFMRLVFSRTALLSPDSALQDSASEDRRRDHVRVLFDGIAAVMSAAQESGEVRKDIEPMQAAEMYVSLMLMMIRFWLVNYWRDGQDIEERVMRALDVLEQGLAP